MPRGSHLAPDLWNPQNTISYRVKLLDFSTLEKQNGHFVTDDLREREDDIIWRVRWGKRWLYAYLLIEFQSSTDRFMAVRIHLGF